MQILIFFITTVAISCAKSAWIETAQCPLLEDWSNLNQKSNSFRDIFEKCIFQYGMFSFSDIFHDKKFEIQNFW